MIHDCDAEETVIAVTDDEVIYQCPCGRRRTGPN